MRSVPILPPAGVADDEPVDVCIVGGGINGIAETKIYYVSSRSGSKEIWVMDYDGQGQRQITRLGQVSLSPRISPNNTRIAFSSFLRMSPRFFDAMVST